MNAKAATEFVIMPAEQLSALIARAVKDGLAANQGQPLLVDKQTLARQLGISADHIDHLRKRGLPWVPVGQAVRFEPLAVLAWLRNDGPRAQQEGQ